MTRYREAVYSANHETDRPIIPQTVGALMLAALAGCDCSRSTRAGPAAAALGSSSDAGVTSGNGERSDAGSAPAPTICDLHEQGVFSMCSSCHGDAGGLTIDHSSAQSLYDSLVGVAGASGIDLVTSGDSASSWLWIRLKALHGEPPMPPSGVLSAETLAPVAQWIDADSLDACLHPTKRTARRSS